MHRERVADRSRGVVQWERIMAILTIPTIPTVRPCRRDRKPRRICKRGNARREICHRAIRGIRQKSRRRRSLTVRNSRRVYINFRMKNPYRRSGFLFCLQICQQLRNSESKQRMAFPRSNLSQRDQDEVPQMHLYMRNDQIRGVQYQIVIQ